MDRIENIIKTVVTIAVFFLILQFCINNILELLTIPPITYTQTTSIVIVIYMAVSTISIAWSNKSQ